MKLVDKPSSARAKVRSIYAVWLGFWFAAGLVASYFLIGGQA